jgi:biotin carboxyl carrier protein
MRYLAEIDDQEFPIEILDDHHVWFGDENITVDITSVKGQPLYSLLVNGESYEGYVFPDEDAWQVLLLGQFFSVKVTDERERHLRTVESTIAQPGGHTLKAPMPGLIISICVEESQQVEKDTVLIILESMKMQNELRSPLAGTISHIRVSEGETVEQKQILLTVD